MKQDITLLNKNICIIIKTNMSIKIDHAFIKILFCTLFFKYGLCEYSIRKTSHGKVKGVVENVHGHKKVEKFFGIPYASPPVGGLRLEVCMFSFLQNNDHIT